MTLSCSCDYESEPEPGSVFSYPPDDFSKLKTSKRKRCQSCGELIDLGSFVLEFGVYKTPEHEVEISIYEEDGEIALAHRYLCEDCGGIFFNLKSVGFCAWIGDDMRELLREYQEEYKPQKLTIIREQENIYET